MSKVRYYVGGTVNRIEAQAAPGGLNRPWIKNTLEEAIAHATELCQKTGEPQTVVQTVCIVEKDKPPVKVTYFQ